VNAYFDASALVKKYILEPGSETVRRRLAAAPEASTSRLSLFEVAAAIARKAREGGLSEADRDRILDGLEADFMALVLHDVHAEIARSALSLARRYPLRGADAVHLATALFIAGPVPSSVEFVCSDGSLNETARACGLRVLDPQEL
jgi:predicted nucleic acid-binding protein